MRFFDHILNRHQSHCSILNYRSSRLRSASKGSEVSTEVWGRKTYDPDCGINYDYGRRTFRGAAAFVVFRSWVTGSQDGRRLLKNVNYKLKYSRRQAEGRGYGYVNSEDYDYGHDL